MKVFWTPFARDSLDACLRRLRTDNPSAAGRTITRLLALADGLATFPRRGTPGRLKGTRELTDTRDEYPYILIYRIEASGVAIGCWTPCRDGRP